MGDQEVDKLPAALRPCMLPSPTVIAYTSKDGVQCRLMRYQYCPLKGTTGFRLLRLHSKMKCLSHEDGALIPTVEIVHVTVEDHEPYRAISYVWGDADDCGFVAVKLGSSSQCCQLTVSRSLLLALQRLVSDTEGDMLFVDQICINQNDLAERERQVALFGHIFKGAVSTIAWLDPTGNDYVGAAFDAISIVRSHVPSGLISQDANAMRAEERNHIRSLLPPSVKEFNVQDAAAQILRLLRHSWFQRLWTFQEAVISQELRFVSGDRTCTYSDLHHACFILTFLIELDQVRGPDSFLYSLRRFRLHHQRQHGADYFALIDNMAWYRYQCSDPRDHIYASSALNGLQQTLDLPVDYSIDLAELNRQLVRSSVEKLGSLNFLLSAGARTRMNGDRASWLPELSRQDFVARPSWIDRDFSACPHFRHRGGPLVDNVLAAQGRQVALIRKSFKYDFPQVSRAGPSTARLTKFQGADKLLDQLLAEVRRVQAPHQLHQEAQWHEWLDLLALTLEMGESSAHVERMSLERLQDHFREVHDRPMRNDRSRTDAWQPHHAQGRRLAMLDSTAWPLALVPSNAREGDHICILHGADWPILLRLIDDKYYQNMGACYVHGIMHGEAVRWAYEEADDFPLK